MRFERLTDVGHSLGLKTAEAKVTGFAFDSREVKTGDLFFALKGTKFNGHDFIRDVAAKGAVAAVVEQGYQGETGGIILLRVPDVIAALQKLAHTIQKRRRQRVIAVTGSVGKTTTKEFIATLLAQKYSVAKTLGNSNSQVGLPLAILNSPGTEDVFVVEMGMTESGQIAKLVDIIPPEMALITKIGHAHMEYFADGIDGIAAAKAEIFSHPQTVWKIGSCQAMGFEAVRKGGNKVTFGVAPQQGDYILEDGYIVKEHGVASPFFRLPFTETHFCENFVGAVAVARLMGLSWDQIIKGAGQLKAAERRFEKFERDGVVFINDCYNANPESMQAAIENLPRPSFGAKTIAVFGEMVELGSYAEEGHRNVAQLASEKVDHVLCYGKGCLPMLKVFGDKGKPAELFRDLNKLKTTLFEISKPGDVVLIKGSNSNKLWQILDYSQ